MCTRNCRNCIANRFEFIFLEKKKTFPFAGNSKYTKVTGHTKNNFFKNVICF